MPSSSPSLSRGIPAFAPAATPEPDPARCLRATFPEAGGAIELPALAGAAIGPNDALIYDVLPVAGQHDRWAATAIALEVELDGGERAGGLVDQYGSPATPAAQADAKRLWVDQWNRRVLSLAAFAGRRIARVRAVCASPEAAEAFFGDIALRPEPERPRDLLGWVDTRRGSHSSDRFSRGNTAPVVGLPHGGVFGLPMTDASAGNWPYRYQVARPALQAFATSRIPSPWIGDRGVFQLMPSPLADPDVTRGGRALAFAREDEHAGPDAYRVALAGVDAELTAAEHAIGLRLASRTGALSVIVDNLGEAISATWGVEGGALRIDVALRDAAGPTHHAHAVIPRPERVDLAWRDGELRGSVLVAGGSADVIVGTSTIGADEARRHADAAGFDEMRLQAERAWREALGRVAIPDADRVRPDVMRSIAGSLARVFAYPNRHDEETPRGRRYRSPADGAVRDGEYSSNNGFWDTYRTAWPLLGLLSPQTAGRLADGFVQHFADAGWVARWSAPGPVDSMTGTTSDTVFAGLAEQGVPLRIREAYASALRHATVPSADPRVGRKGLSRARFRGFVDTDVHEGMSWTLDNAINDASAARLAARLAAAEEDPAARERLETERDHLARRALHYRHVFHEGLGFFLGRTPDGAWRVEGDAFDPAEWGHDYTETNAWGTAFTAPHDGAGLAELHGGEAALGAALDAFFATPETADPSLVGSYGFVIHEMAEARDVRMGMLGLSNQPAHHIPLTYCHAGRHDDAHRIVVEARDRLFAGSDLGQGYPGDEDNGELSAWYLFAVLGLYPLVPGSGEFVLTPPLLPRVELRPEGRAEPLVIEAERAGSSYIARVEIDGEPWDRIAVPAATLARARRISFTLTDEPAGWARDSRPSSFSHEFGVAGPLEDVLARVPGSVTDDEGAAPRALAAGEAVEAALAAEGEVASYAVTLGGGPVPFPVPAGSAVRARWRLEAVAPDGRIHVLDERDEEFDVAGQTRPFRVRLAAGPVRAIRFVAREPLELAQLEAFGP